MKYVVKLDLSPEDARKLESLGQQTGRLPEDVLAGLIRLCLSGNTPKPKSNVEKIRQLALLEAAPFLSKAGLSNRKIAQLLGVNSRKVDRFLAD